MQEQVLVFFIREITIIPFILKLKQVLLAQKSPGAKVAANMWNGYGGDIEQGETAKKALMREISEETRSGIYVREEDLIPMGIIDFFFYENRTNQPTFKVHLFVCHRFSGRPKESREMTSPTWFFPIELSQLNMMPADKYFIPLVLSGKPVLGKVRFSSNFKKLEKIRIERII